MRNFFFLCCFILPTLALAQDDCCCCEFRKKGQAEFDAKRYKTAIEKWERGLRCVDKDQCGDLSELISKARNKIPKLQPKKKTISKKVDQNALECGFFTCLV